MPTYGVARAQRCRSDQPLPLQFEQLELQQHLGRMRGMLVPDPAQSRRAGGAPRPALTRRSVNTWPCPGMTTRGRSESIRSSVAPTSSKASWPSSSWKHDTEAVFPERIGGNQHAGTAARTESTECGSCPGAPCTCQHSVPQQDFRPRLEQSVHSEARALLSGGHVRERHRIPMRDMLGQSRRNQRLRRPDIPPAARRCRRSGRCAGGYSAAGRAVVRPRPGAPMPRSAPRGWHSRCRPAPCARDRGTGCCWLTTSRARKP